MPHDHPVITTGVPGLDEVLQGGFPVSNIYLLKGAPGSGKTTAALQFLRAGVARGERGLYVSLSQSRAELEQIAASHGWSLEGIDIEELSAAEGATAASDQSIFQTADLRLDETRKAIVEAVSRYAPKRIVYDSLLEIRVLTGDEARFRRELIGLKSVLAAQGITALLIDTDFDRGRTRNDEIEAIAHGVVRLDKTLPDYGVARRRIEVSKMRGTPVADGYHDMVIREGEGVVVFPRIVPRVVPEQTKSLELIKSGVENLDNLLGGGQEAGTTTLVIGQAGTGKSTMASLYATAALERGEHVALFLFEERVETFFRRSEGLGMKLRSFHDSGELLIKDFNPGEVTAGQFGQIVQEEVAKGRTRVVVIDSFTGYLSALPNRDQAVQDIQSLLKFLARRGILTMLIVAQHGLIGENVSIDVDVSFLGDTVLLLRISEEGDRLKRSITVVKKRHGPHAMSVHELAITSDGVSVSPAPLDGPVA
ncbi:AAA family ATPase [Aurantimonas sp. MSK8Z-1]|uniref:ATPase domain-containing protein n=1 Tax=Mangrovibrevibacter kandeliae TaxID=2968473 RepID=UPI00222EE4B2|nr:ATPase domain-containing protein [Aurantimonas sp. MSK8Z-1]MCW4117121.1 AAA family ATPase [Aurantimonas sp. MSK8Z-1]